MRRNNNKVYSIETGRIVIVCSRRFSITDDKFYCHNLIYKNSFTCSYIWTTYQLINDRKII